MNKIHNRHTVVKSILSVKHVETNTPKLNFWRNTCVVIVERGLLSARSADDLLDFYRHWMNTTTNTTTVLLLLKEKMLQPQIQPPRYKTPHKQLDTRQGQSPTVSDCHRGRNKFICTFSVELLKTLWMFLENLEDCAGWSSSQLARLHPHHRVFSHVEFLHDHTDKTVEAGMCHIDQPYESNYLQVGKNLHRVKWVCQKQTNNDLLRTALYASWQLFVWSLFRPKQLHISGLNCPSIQVDWM